MECKSLRSHITDSRFYRTGYSTDESRLIFCDIRRLQRWLDVEVALATSQANLGIIPLSAAEELMQTARLDQFDLKQISKSIKSTGHSLMPLLAAWQKATSPESSTYLHYGATTQDIQDTAQSLEIKELLSIVERDLCLVVKELTRRVSMRSIDAAAERNEWKWGHRTPGTNIPIISEADSRAANPDYFLVLPWHFRDEFVKREADYIAKGGRLIFPLPELEVYPAA